MTVADLFARPAWLWLGLLALPLVALHIKRRRRARVVIPSLLLFESGGAGEAPPRGLGRLLRDRAGLLMEGGALVCLVLAAAGPFPPARPAMPRPVSIVLDGSASTTARRTVDGDDGDTRFARQVGLARRLVEGLPEEVPVSVVVARDEVVVAAAGVSRKEALAALAAARPVIVADTCLAAAVDAARAGGADVVVFTDGCDPAAPAPSEDVHVVVVGGESVNGGVIALAEEVRPGEESSTVARVLRADGTVEDVVFRGEPVDPPSGDGVRPRDVLPCDDMQWHPVHGPPLRVVTVSPGGVIPHHLRAALEAAEPMVDREESRSCNPSTASSLPPPDVWVFSGAEAALPGPALVLGAADGPVLEAPAVRTVDGQHPVMRGVDPSELLVARARTLAPQPGDAVLLEGPDGPLALAGTRGGARRLILGFLPEESNLPLGTSWPVLVRNALLWVTEPERIAAGSDFKAGSMVELEVAAEGTVRMVEFQAGFRVNGTEWPDPPTPTRLPVVNGRVRFRVPSPEEIDGPGYRLKSGDDVVASFTPLLLDEHESRLHRYLPVNETAPTLRRGGPPPARHPWERDLALLAMAFLGAEWWWWARLSPIADSFRPSAGTP